jgi:mitochondrial import inner membrane translocase subunit TIM23
VLIESDTNTFAFAGVGYLMGPSIGAAFWRMTHRRTMNLIEVKDRLFHQHIVRNRVDPSQQSARNFVPDYYGIMLLFGSTAIIIIEYANPR